MTPMHLVLQRQEHDAEATRGELTIDGAHQCLILEDQPRSGPKVAGETRIPAGIYDLELKKLGTSKFDDTAIKFMAGEHRGMIRLKAVPGFNEILIHWGNFEWQTDGCLLTGTGPQKDSNGHLAVTASRDAYKKVYPKIAAAILACGARLEIRDEP